MPIHRPCAGLVLRDTANFCAARRCDPWQAIACLEDWHVRRTQTPAVFSPRWRQTYVVRNCTVAAHGVLRNQRRAGNNRDAGLLHRSTTSNRQGMSSQTGAQAAAENSCRRPPQGHPPPQATTTPAGFLARRRQHHYYSSTIPLFYGNRSSTPTGKASASSIEISRGPGTVDRPTPAYTSNHRRGILLAESQNIEVHGNALVDNGTGRRASRHDGLSRGQQPPGQHPDYRQPVQGNGGRSLIGTSLGDWSPQSVADRGRSRIDDNRLRSPAGSPADDMGRCHVERPGAGAIGAGAGRGRRRSRRCRS